jgi:hypothetical protein
VKLNKNKDWENKYKKENTFFSENTKLRQRNNRDELMLINNKEGQKMENLYCQYIEKK